MPISTSMTARAAAQGELNDMRTSLLIVTDAVLAALFLK